jgi:hypothetical protein
VLLDAGAQLSFGIVLGLILIGPPITRFLIQPFSPDPFLPLSLLTMAERYERRFWWIGIGLFASGIAAALVSEPITAIDFHQVTPISIFANLVVVPTAGLITMIGTLSVAVSLISTPLAALLNNANWLFARLLILFVGYLAHKPGASLNVADLRTLGAPTPSFIVAPLQDSACLLVRAPDAGWLINTGRETPVPSTTWHLLQFYGLNRLDGLVLAQMSGPDNSGAAAIIKDFQPHQLVVPVLRTKSPLEKTLPDMIALAGRDPDSWQAGQSVTLGQGVRVDVLSPSSDSTESRADDRALVLLFHAANGTLLWAGRIGAQTQHDLLATHPGLHADVLVMATDPPPGAEFLRALGVREWLQIPARDRQLNASDQGTMPAACEIWPLNQTGSVEIHFGPEGQMQLRPCLALPAHR